MRIERRYLPRLTHALLVLVLLAAAGIPARAEVCTGAVCAAGAAPPGGSRATTAPGETASPPPWYEEPIEQSAPREVIAPIPLSQKLSAALSGKRRATFLTVVGEDGVARPKQEEDIAASQTHGQWMWLLAPILGFGVYFVVWGRRESPASAGAEHEASPRPMAGGPPVLKEVFAFAPERNKVLEKPSWERLVAVCNGDAFEAARILARETDNNPGLTATSEIALALATARATNEAARQSKAN